MMLLQGQATKDDVSGPIGIAQFVGDTYDEVKDYGISSVVFTMMNIIILLSVNLGIKTAHAFFLIIDRPVQQFLNIFFF